MTELDGLEIKVAFGGIWKESLTELSGGQRSGYQQYSFNSIHVLYMYMYVQNTCELKADLKPQIREKRLVTVTKYNLHVHSIIINHMLV